MGMLDEPQKWVFVAVGPNFSLKLMVLHHNVANTILFIDIT